ncbi:MAG: ABC transporter permease [Oscillospiraceae bacterium]|nr:ABC transporter permease [Oscillospiraceae bacterium]
MKRLRVPKPFIFAVAAVFSGFVAGALLMLIIGKNPIVGYAALFRGAVKNPAVSLSAVGQTLIMSAILCLSGLSLAFAGKVGLFNIGAAGQMLIGGFAASVAVYRLPTDCPKALTIAVILVVGAFGGAVWAGVAGVLKARFGINEVVATIMLNWVAFWTVDYFVRNYFPRDAYVKTTSRVLPDAMSLRLQWLEKIFDSRFVNFGLFVAVAMVVLTWFIMNKTVFGFELRAVGANRFAAEYAGIHAGTGTVCAMLIAGALAGLAGVTYYLGYVTSIQVGVLPSYGYDGIAVALVGQNSPGGVAAAALLFGVLRSGKDFMTIETGIMNELADCVIAIIIYFSAAIMLYEKLSAKLTKKRAAAPAAAETGGGKP